MVSFTEKIKQQRNKNSSSTSFTDRYISGSGLIQKIKAVDSKNQKPALYYLLVQKSKQKAFEEMVEQTKKSGSMNLEDYGKIIASCYGTEPNDRVKEIMKKYGFEL